VAAFYSWEYMFDRESFWRKAPERLDIGGGPVITIRGGPLTIIALENNIYEENWGMKRGKNKFNIFNR
jgi:hypothetical protein